MGTRERTVHRRHIHGTMPRQLAHRSSRFQSLRPASEIQVRVVSVWVTCHPRDNASTSEQPPAKLSKSSNDANKTLSKKQKIPLHAIDALSDPQQMKKNRCVLQLRWCSRQRCTDASRSRAALLLSPSIHGCRILRSEWSSHAWRSESH